MSSRASRSGGIVDRKDVEPVVEVRAESVRADLGREVAVRRGDDADVDRGSAASPPTRSISRSWRTRRSFACASSGSSPISSRKSVPPSRELEAADAPSACAPVNAPFSWPKSSLSMSVGASAAQFTLTSGACATRAQLVERAREELLAGSGLAEQEHGRRRRRDALELAERASERGALADDARRPRTASKLLFQVRVLGLEAAGQLADPREELAFLIATDACAAKMPRCSKSASVERLARRTSRARRGARRRRRAGSRRTTRARWLRIHALSTKRGSPSEVVAADTACARAAISPIFSAPIGTRRWEPSRRSESPALATSSRTSGVPGRTSQIARHRGPEIAHEPARDLAEHLAEIERARHPKTDATECRLEAGLFHRQDFSAQLALKDVDVWLETGLTG